MEDIRRDREVREQLWEEHVSTYKRKVDLLDRELENINREFEEVENKKAKIATEHGDRYVYEDDIMEINVGGKVITASRGTLTCQKGNMLEALFSGRWDKEIQCDGSGRIFLDVNLECFQIMINYLSMLRNSSEEMISQCLDVENELQPMLNSTMTYFGIKHTTTFKNDNRSSSTGQTHQQTQAVLPDKVTWETMNFNKCPTIPRNIKESLYQEQKSMKNAKEKLQRAKDNLEKEYYFIQHISEQSPTDIINFDVRGTMMAAKRSTLRIFKDSQLDRQFDDATWPDQHTNTPSAKEWSYKQVADWAKQHNELSDDVAALLEENKVTGLELLAMGREDLKDLGIGRPGTLALVMKAIKVLQMKSQCSPIFIDHDPYCFGKILDQLRLKVMSKEDYKPLLLSCIKEAKKDIFAKTVDYYFPGELAHLIFKNCSLDSDIVSQDEVDIIQGWLDEDGCGSLAELLYRGSSDGWETSDFHAKCNNQGPTLTIIRCTGGYIFGGFCDTAWSSAGCGKTSPKAFIFTLKCHSGLPPTKMRLNERYDGDAVYHNTSFGPTFGDDIICTADNTNHYLCCNTNVGHSYDCPQGQDGDTFLTGSEDFQVSEIEVFSVQQKE
mmetsp:Transcript_37611/g.55012  ORF Transcript_37611/g.55012 Transcript_37611/m.55012 type:complete len:610 (-) Transcript_37611:354-2183(-)